MTNRGSRDAATSGTEADGPEGIDLALGMASLEFLSPVAPARVVERPLADRPATLDEAHVALLDNQKANAGHLLAAVGRELARRHPAMTISTERKIATSASPAEVMDRLRTCDAVVLAIAD